MATSQGSNRSKVRDLSIISLEWSSKFSLFKADLVSSLNLQFQEFTSKLNDLSDRINNRSVSAPQPVTVDQSLGRDRQMPPQEEPQCAESHGGNRVGRWQDGSPSIPPPFAQHVRSGRHGQGSHLPF